jgi:hypothetical protein
MKRTHTLLFATLLFCVLFYSVHVIKPKLVYNEDGGFRPFGLGYKHKTILPIWLISIILAIFSYLLVLKRI